MGKGIREFKGSIKEIEKEVKAVGEETAKDAVPPAADASDEKDEGPRRLTTTPVPDSSVSHPGGVSTAESQAEGGAAQATFSESPTEERAEEEKEKEEA